MFDSKKSFIHINAPIAHVPVHENDVINTIQSLARTPGEAGIVPLKLKRKKEYTNIHKEEYVSVQK